VGKMVTKHHTYRPGFQRCMVFFRVSESAAVPCSCFLTRNPQAMLLTCRRFAQSALGMMAMGLCRRHICQGYEYSVVYTQYYCPRTDFRAAYLACQRDRCDATLLDLSTSSERIHKRMAAWREGVPLRARLAFWHGP
jgi:hypothetical protein